MSLKTDPRRVLVKFGSGILTKPGTVRPDSIQFARLTAAIAELKERGHEVILVSSGAVAAGLQDMGLDHRPEDIPTLQACAAVGQCHLMHHYESLFRQHDLTVAQLLVTHEDLEHPSRCERFRQTLERLLKQENVVPVINENDSVAVEELRYGDNDALSARVAVLAGADLVVLLTSVDGLLDADNRTVPEVPDLDEAATWVRAEKGGLSVGGMATKLQAVRRCLEAKIPVLIASGRRAEQLPDLVEGQGIATRFPVPNS